MKIRITTLLLQRLFKSISIVRLVAGSYNEDYVQSKWKRILLRMYSFVVVFALCVYCGFTYAKSSISFTNILGFCSEPALLSITSQFYNSCPADYFNSVLSRCRTGHSRRLIFYVLICAYFRAFIYQICLCVLPYIFCHVTSGWCADAYSWNYIFTFIRCILSELQRAAAFLSIGLLYCDFKNLQETIKRKGVLKVDIVDMYEGIFEDFRRVEQAAKQQVFIITLNLMYPFIAAVTEILGIFKRENGDVTLNALLISSLVLVTVNSGVLVCVIEYIYELQDQIMVYLLDLGIFSTYEPLRVECARVRWYLRERRLNLVVGGAVRLGAPLLLNLASLTATYTIAATQIRNIWGH